MSSSSEWLVDFVWTELLALVSNPFFTPSLSSFTVFTNMSSIVLSIAKVPDGSKG